MQDNLDGWSNLFVSVLYTDIFFEIVRAGLWGGQGPVSGIKFHVSCDEAWSAVYQLAQEQSVQGLVLRGIEWFNNHNLNADLDLNIPKALLLQWIGEVQMMEQRNKEMNAFIAELIDKLRKAGIYTLLVKGQGVAQCYENPLWRCSGDVDLFLSHDNYEKAKVFIKPLAQYVDFEDKSRLHLGMTVDGWVVELHGTMHTKLSRRMNRVADEVHSDLFYNGNVRSWDNNGVQVFLPSANNDAIIIFNHIINHFFMEGVGLRQICDWCRLLWMYKDSLNYGLLEQRIKRAGLMSEWKAFYNLASRYLGMPNLGEGLLACDSRFDKRADRIMAFVLESGNFGHNRDVSYRVKYSSIVVNAVTLWRRIYDFARFMRVFPVDAPKFFGQYLWNRMLYS